jgi:nucleotidyltransferase/DNA polymerase involved in DNA repair
MTTPRVIIHLDMDAFFAAVEQRDHPEYRGKPVIVGADPKGGKGRGVVSTCSYEARKFGIHSAMPISRAWKLCPHGIYVHGRMGVYAQVSRQVRAILEQYTPMIEPVSIDEAFMDVTQSLHLFGGKRAIAESIQHRVLQETQLTASLGVAPCKLVAKIASDLKKPQGLVIVEPNEVESFLRPLPMRKLWGAGPKTCEALARLGIHTIGDLAGFDPGILRERFGAHGEHLWGLAHGRDDRPVEAVEEVKSVGNETTFEEDTRDVRRILSTLMSLCEEVANRLREASLRGRTITTKVRYEGFETHTRSRTVETPLDTAPDIYRIALENLERAEYRGRKVRLVGVTASNFEPGPGRQTGLFGPAPKTPEETRKKQLLSAALDQARKRHGDDVLRHARGMERKKTSND